MYKRNWDVGKCVSCKMCDDWNHLLAYIVNATTLDTFKDGLDRL